VVIQHLTVFFPSCQLRDDLLPSNFTLFNVDTFLIALLFCETILCFVMETVHEDPCGPKFPAVLEKTAEK